jgi:ABC-type multidrug transport system ATPase subunit
MISARNLTKLYRGAAVISDVSLDVSAGDGMALYGPPSGGKTTLLRLLGSWLEPSSGTIRIGGFDARADLWQARSHVTYAASNALVGTGLTVEEYLRFVVRVRSRTAPSRSEATPIRDALQQAQLSPTARVDALGAAQRAALALAALVVAPSDVVLIDGALDEVEASPRAAFSEWLLEARRRGAALVVATAANGEPLRLCNRRAQVNAGQVTETAPAGSQTGSA